MMQLSESQLVQIIWRRLPSRMKTKIDVKRLHTFIEVMEDGETLATAAKAARIPQAVAVDLMVQIEKLGLL